MSNIIEDKYKKENLEKRNNKIEEIIYLNKNKDFINKRQIYNDFDNIVNKYTELEIKVLIYLLTHI
jgi:hypothetical protein